MGNARNIAFWVVLFLLILALFNLFSGGQSSLNARSVSYSDFVEQGQRSIMYSFDLGFFERLKAPPEETRMHH